MKKFEWEDADIKVNVSAKSLEESNLILRKFYDEINKTIQVGWQFMNVRTGNTIEVGDCNFGTMWFDYKQSGLINNIFISTKGRAPKQIVESALKEAIANHNNFEKYGIEAVFYTKDIHFSTMCKNDILLTSDLAKNGNTAKIRFNINAFGKLDAKYIITQKINYLKHLFCAYTNFLFKLKCVYKSEKSVECEETKWNNYDPDWIDCFFDDEKKDVDAELIPDFFDIFRIILDNDSYKKTMRLLLNSAQEIYCAQKMMKDSVYDPEYNSPGFVDMLNTLLISALEPLSNIGARKAEICPECGNVKYKIRKKVETLCSQYTNDYITKVLSNIGYSQRSSFLHEGNAKTNEFYCGTCIPLINPSAKNELLMASSVINQNTFDYVAYIFRKKVHDLLEDKTTLLS